MGLYQHHSLTARLEWLHTELFELYRTFGSKPLDDVLAHHSDGFADIGQAQQRATVEALRRAIRDLRDFGMAGHRIEVCSPCRTSIAWTVDPAGGPVPRVMAEAVLTGVAHAFDPSCDGLEVGYAMTDAAVAAGMRLGLSAVGA